MVKPHIGAEADPMHASDGGCLFHGRSPADPRCTKQAVRHLMITSLGHLGRATVSVATCRDHEPVARATGVVLREHEHEPVCGWPGSIWLDPPENRCALDESGVSLGRALVSEAVPVST